MTKPEVTKRLAIKAVLGANLPAKRQHVAALFQTSLRVVTDAARHTTAQLAAMLAIAPAPRPRARVAVPTASAVGHPTTPRRPGSRARAKLEKPEHTVEYEEQVDFDVPEPVIDDEAQEKAITKAIEEQDRKLREGKGTEVE